MINRIFEVLTFLFLMALVVALVLVVGWLVVARTEAPKNPCSFPTSFECRHLQVQKCVESELYTRAECIALVGGGAVK